MTLSLSFDELRSIANNLAAGFQVLQDYVEEQQKIEQRLRTRLEKVTAKCEELEASCNSSTGEISDWRDEIVKQISPSETTIERTPRPPIFEQSMETAKAAMAQLKESTAVSPKMIRKCPVAHQAIDRTEMEQDFTTKGTPSNLGCPFAKMQDGKSQDLEDPIAAEFHTDKSSARSNDAFGRCPIRFIDKHSPEEIAEYFEKHKHEIPRSHEICVKRYQQNEQEIRQLDAKYGNLVNMIQGLGSKHKQYLPHEKVSDEPDGTSNKAVEQWAENVSPQATPPEETERVPRFDKPLRDIRVGESPSRPWGISVPVNKSPAISESPSLNNAEQSAKPVSTTPAPVPADVHQFSESRQSHISACPPRDPPQIVFNGPVFFGYSAEQAAIFLQHLGISSTKQ